MDQKKPPQEDLQQTAAGAPSKKAYAAPKLIEYGSVAKLTATGVGSVGDGSQTMMCL